MAARYWVGGAGTWDATTTTHWSATNGGAGGATVPGTGDDVYFTSNSSSTSYTVTRTATTAVLSITMAGPASGTLTFAGTSAIGISTGNLTVGATGTVSWTNTGILTKTGNGNIDVNGVTINSPIVFNAPGAMLTLLKNLTMGTATTFTLTAGTLNVGSWAVALSCGLFSSSNSNTRSISFGASGRINVTNTATNTVWNMGTVTGFTTTGTPNVNLTGAAASGVTRTITLGAAAAAYLNFTISAGAAGSTVSISSGNNITFTSGYSGAVTNAAGSINGALILSSTISAWTASSSILTFSGTNSTINSAGETIVAPITVTGTLTLASALTQSTYNFTIDGGTFNTNGFNFTCALLMANSGTINTSSGTTFTVSSTTGIGSASGYNPTINFISSTVSLAAVTFSSGSITTTGSAVTCTSTLNQTRNSSATSSSLNVSDCSSFTVNGLYTVGGYSTTGVATFNLSNKTVNINSMAVGGTDNLTTIVFGTTGVINLTGNAATIWNSASSANLTMTGTVDIRSTYTGSTGTRTLVADTVTTTIQVPMKITAGAGTVSIYGSWSNVDFTGYSGAIAPATTLTITSSLVIPATVTSVSSASTLEFSGTGSTTLNTTGEIIDMPVTLTSGSFTQLSSLTVGSSRTVSINGGTYNSNGFNFTCGTVNIGLSSPYNPTVNFVNSSVTSSVAASLYSGSVLTSGSTLSFVTLYQSGNSSATSCDLDVSNCVSFTTSGLYTIDGYSTTSGATLDLTNKTINVQSMAVGVTDDLTTLIFGTSGRINLTGNNGTIWTSASGSYITMTGTVDIRATYTGTTGTRTFIADAAVSSYQVPIKITAGSDTVSIYGSWSSVDFTGFSGPIAPASVLTITSSLIIPATVTSVSSAYALTFNGLPTATLTTSGETIDMPVTVADGTLSLNDSLTMGSTRILTLTAGTLTTNGNGVSCSSFSSSNSNFRTVNLGSSTITLTGTGTVWNMATSTNSTVNAGTSTIVLSDNTITARVFAGGGKTYYNLVIGGNTTTSTTTISGGNTFNNLSSTKTVAHTVTFTTNTTTTFANFSLSGTSGNVVTLASSSTLNPFTFIKSGSGVVECDYLSISYSTATPANTWYAGATSTQGTAVSGWIFTAAPSLSANTFFFGSAF